MLSREDTHHAWDVLRLRAGNLVTVVEPISQRAYEAIISRLAENLCAVKVLRPVPENTFRGRVSVALIALIKGERLELACEKCTELGVEHFVLFMAERSVVRFEESKVARKVERLQKIVEGAAKQSSKVQIPTLTIVGDLRSALQVLDKTLPTEAARLVFSLRADAAPINSLTPSPQAVHITVGPEGDFTPDEEKLLQEHRFQPVSLGPFVLRAETASIAGVAGINTLWGPREQPSR